MEELNAFIESNPDPRELKRALAVRMTLRGYPHREIMKILQVCSGYISKWKQAFIINGIEGIKLGYQGSKSYIAQEFNVTFVAKSSYYDLFHEAGISWKKSQKKNPGKDPEAVASKKKEIETFLEKNREESESENLLIFFLDECHLIWGDICGYVWGKTDRRIEIPIKNEKEKQTYYGAINYLTPESDS
jgi:transposase